MGAVQVEELSHWLKFSATFTVVPIILVIVIYTAITLSNDIVLILHNVGVPFMYMLLGRDPFTPALSPKDFISHELVAVCFGLMGEVLGDLVKKLHAGDFRKSVTFTTRLFAWIVLGANFLVFTTILTKEFSIDEDMLLYSALLLFFFTLLVGFVIKWLVITSELKQEETDKQSTLALAKKMRKLKADLYRYKRTFGSLPELKGIELLYDTLVVDWLDTDI